MWLGEEYIMVVCEGGMGFIRKKEIRFEGEITCCVLRGKGL